MYTAAVIDNDLNCLVNILGLLRSNLHIISADHFSCSSDYLNELAKRQINIAFIRLGNPELQGLSLARKTKEISPSTRVVFMSSSQSYSIMAFEEGAWGYLLLPARKESLEAVIENIRCREIGERGDSF